MSEIQKLEYVDYSFDNLVTQLQNNLAAKSTWKDTYRSATGQMLIELFAAIGSLVLYYIERRAEESYINTAKNYSSVLNLARLVNYVPRRNVSAVGTLRFTLATPSTNLVFIPQYTRVTDSSGLSYLVKQDGVIIAGQLYTDVPGIQGELVTLEYTSAGINSQEYIIADTKVEDTNFTVTIDGVAWTLVTSFVNSTAISTHYVIRAELDGNITLVFGDGVNGKSPTAGATIAINYVKSDGIIGNAYTTGGINTIVSTLYDSTGSTASVTVSNTTTFTGGDDAEDVENIRYNAPRVFATGDRLVTKADFIAHISQYPSVADVNAWGEAEETAPDYNHYNQVKICCILQDWVTPDSSFQAGLTSDLYLKSLQTVRYSYVDPVILDLIPTLTIKAVQGYSLSYIQAQVEAALEARFILGDTTQLDTDVRHSDIVAAIDAIQGVSYNHTTLKIQKRLLSDYDSTYDWSETMDALPLAARGVEVYVNSTRVAVDNGSGSWTATGSYGTTGVVNYSSGAVGINLTPAVGPLDVVYCRYQQDDSGDIIVGLNQICRYAGADYISLS